MMGWKSMDTHKTLSYLLGIVLILAISLALFYALMQPAAGDLGLMVLLLFFTAVISALAGYAAYRLGWIERSPSLRLTLMGIYALASVLAFFNVWITARLMFASRHDLLLATVLLIFAGGIAMTLGNFLSSTLAERIHRLEVAANEVQHGDLTVQVDARGKDELASLAHTFNQMAARLNDAAQKQQEMEKLRRDLIAWAGHDLQTPLASVRAILEALADGVVDDPETIQRYFRTAQRDIQQLSLLIDDMFQMSQLDAGGLPLDREPASLSDLISDTLESFSELASRQGVLLEGSVAAGIDPVFMDVRRIGRVLNNLVANALRHTPAGGKVSVMASLISEAVRVEVSDSGEGISGEDQPHIFERFYRGEKSRSRLTGGAGLGLAIAKGIVEAHNGQIGVENKSEGGACFYFILPSKER
jgi:signal transduction histidine kinase